MDFSSFCRTFYVSHYVPIGYFEDRRERYAAGIPDDMPSSSLLIHLFADADRYPAVYMMRNVGLYGAVRSNETGGVFIVGPVCNNTVSGKVVHAFMRHHALPDTSQPAVERFLGSIPQYSYNRFIYLLVFLHQIINGETLSAAEHFNVSDVDAGKDPAAAGQSLYEKAVGELEQREHGTYCVEQMIIDYVRRGNPGRMRQFLVDTAAHRPLAEGLMSDSPLRQAKNVFLSTVTMVGKAGAIPGGMDIEETYRLIDSYIQECERLLTPDAVRTLQLNMLIDFTTRVQQVHLPKGLSHEVASCIQYIDNHLTDDISVRKIADHINRSNTYLERRFKTELGTSVGKYVTACRMQEAKIWLAETDRPLSEISRYLHYSSQPYFQNVFKKMNGITPMQYRREQRQAMGR